MFKPGDRVKHKASGEIGIVLETISNKGSANFDCKLSIGFDREVEVPEDLLAPAAPAMAEVADDGSLIEDEGVVVGSGQPDGSTFQARVGEETLELTVLGRRGGGLLCRSKDGFHLVLRSRACDVAEFDRLIGSAKPIN